METNPEMTDMMELADKDFKTDIMNMHKDLENWKIIYILSDFVLVNKLLVYQLTLFTSCFLSLCR